MYPPTHITSDMCIPSKMAASNICTPHPLPSTLNNNILLERALVVQSLSGRTKTQRTKIQISIFIVEKAVYTQLLLELCS